MRRNKLIKRFCCGIIAAAMVMSLTACGGGTSTEKTATDTDAETAKTEEIDTSWYTNSDNVVYTDGVELPTLNWNVGVAVEDMFTDRDMSGDYEEKSSTAITLADGASSVSRGRSVDSDEGDVSVEGDVITISSKGTYILSGSLTDGQIIVDAGDDKVQLVLNGVDITSANSAAIYVKSADKVFVTSADGSENSLETSGEFVADGETNVDGVIFSKDDITFNGSGTLSVTTENAHGIVSKDDLKITAGNYVIEAADHGLTANDSIRIAGGDIDISCGEDGLHTNNFEDEGKGFVYIQDGTLRIAAGDDGIHASLNVRVDGGDIIVSESYEGIEGQTIDINGGNIDVTSSDDGFNAASSSMDSGDVEDDFNGGFGGFDGTMPDGFSMATPTDGEMPMMPDGETPDMPDGENAVGGDGTMPGMPDGGMNQDGATADGDSTAPSMPDGESAMGGDGTMPSMPDGAVNQDGTTSDGDSAVPSMPDGEMPSMPDGENGMGGDGTAPTMPDGGDSNSDTEGGAASGNTDGNDKGGGKGGMDFGGGGGAFDTDSNCYINITGGNIYVDADGDGLDSNGVMVVSGGVTYVEGPTNSGNGALDYGTYGYITGGIVIASGASGMAESFSYAENQGSIEVNFSNMTTGKIYIEDADGNELASTTTSKSFNSVVISCPGISEGETYTIHAGEQSETITMDSLLYGSSSMMQGGGMQGGMDFGGQGRQIDGMKHDEDEMENDHNDGHDGQTDSNYDASQGTSL